jgi:hypothetical protein
MYLDLRIKLSNKLGTRPGGYRRNMVEVQQQTPFRVDDRLAWESCGKRRALSPRAQAKSLSPHLRFVIALPSPVKGAENRAAHVPSRELLWHLPFTKLETKRHAGSTDCLRFSFVGGKRKKSRKLRSPAYPACGPNIEAK